MKNSKQTNIQTGDKHKDRDKQGKPLFEYETQTVRKRKISIRSPKWIDKLFQKTKSQ